MKNLNEIHPLQKQLNESGLIPCFEIEVIDKKTNEKDYINYDIEVKENKLIAYRIGLTEEEEKSDKIAFDSIDIDMDFSFDENFQNLYDEIINSIIDSEFFKLPEETNNHFLKLKLINYEIHKRRN